MSTIYESAKFKGTNLLLHFLSLFPPKALQWPYQVFANILRVLFPLVGATVYLRNSYYFGDLVPGLSDLDFTLHFERSPHRLKLKLTFLFRRVLAILFPKLGELNLYCGRDWRLANEYGNILELRRSEQFHTANLNSRPASLEEKLVFLSRMLEADSTNLNRRFSFRKKKWARHLEECGLTFDSLNSVQELLNYLNASFFKFFPALELHAFFLEYIIKFNGEPEHQLATGKYRHEFCIVYPHRWAWLDRTFQFAQMPTLSSRAVFSQQCQWEVMGLISQYRMMDVSWILAHIQKLRTGLNTFPSERYQLEAQRALDALENECRQYSKPVL